MSSACSQGTTCSLRGSPRCHRAAALCTSTQGPGWGSRVLVTTMVRSCRRLCGCNPVPCRAPSSGGVQSGVVAVPLALTWFSLRGGNNDPAPPGRVSLLWALCVFSVSPCPQPRRQQTVAVCTGHFLGKATPTHERPRPLTLSLSCASETTWPAEARAVCSLPRSVCRPPCSRTGWAFGGLLASCARQLPPWAARGTFLKSTSAPSAIPHMSPKAPSCPLYLPSQLLDPQ